jgi:5-methylcytosine-specific restriction endonuclease McrA
MPIKPENRSRYPANWKEIRAVILTRAGNCCEQCKVPNGTRVARGAGRFVDTFMTDDAEVYCADTGESLGRVRMSDYEVKNMVDIVLTIAHLDHTPENCDPDNLRALCQRCHLRYDAAHHAETARNTRRERLAVADLFAGDQQAREDA